MDINSNNALSELIKSLHNNLPSDQWRRTTGRDLTLDSNLSIRMACIQQQEWLYTAALYYKKARIVEPWAVALPEYEILPGVPEGTGMRERLEKAVSQAMFNLFDQDLQPVAPPGPA